MCINIYLVMKSLYCNHGSLLYPLYLNNELICYSLFKYCRNYFHFIYFVLLNFMSFFLFNYWRKNTIFSRVIVTAWNQIPNIDYKLSRVIFYHPNSSMAIWLYRRVLMADASERRVRGRRWLGWTNGVKVALDNIG